jgi:hypothetical protein
MNKLRRLADVSWPNFVVSVHVDDAALADEYAAVLGLDLSADEQLSRFKRSTEGAPVVRRSARRLGAV